MSKTAKTNESEETQKLVSVTFTHTYNHDGVRYLGGETYEVTQEYADFLKGKEVI